MWTPANKCAYAESQLWRNQIKGPCLQYADEVIRLEDPYSLIPEDAALSLQYHNARVQVGRNCLNGPDMFVQANSASIALMLDDLTIVDDLAIKGAVINLWETLAGGKPVPVPPV